VGEVRYVLIAILLGIAVPAAAQSPPEFELPEVIIPGRRPQPVVSTPASVTVLTRDDLDMLGITTLAEALALVPEVFIRAYGGAGSLAEPSIRGFGPGQVLVLLDGVPLNNVALGQADLSTISLNGVERIEVLRGPFAALAGSGALGGVINIVSGRARPAATVRYGGAGERRLSVSGGTGAASYGLDLGGSDGDRPNSDHADVTARIELRPREGLRFAVHHHRVHLGTPGDLAAPTPFDRQASDRTVVQAQWSTASYLARGYYTSEQLIFETPFGTSTYRAVVGGAEWQRRWTLSASRLVVAGLEVQGQRLDALVFGSAIREDAMLAAGYVQYDALLAPRLLTSLGIRLDTHSRYGTAINPRAGVVYSLDERTRIRAAVGRTFRGPTFLHLFFPGCSNPALTAESAWAAEVGAERTLSAGVVGATAFASEAGNLISTGCPPTNVDEASFRGLSLEGRLRVRDRTDLRLNLTGQHAVDRRTGAALPRVPALVANATVTHRLSETSSLGALLRYVGPRHDVDFSVFPAAPVQLPGYVDLGLRYQYRTSDTWTITVGLDNVLDAQYEVVKGFPAPGRRVFFLASGRF
jgi:outer membrane cobalamin receptor